MKRGSLKIRSFKHEIASLSFHFARNGMIISRMWEILLLSLYERNIVERGSLKVRSLNREIASLSFHFARNDT